MKHSRNVLLAAWLILGLAAVFQVVRPGGPTEGETAVETDRQSGALPYAGPPTDRNPGEAPAAEGPPDAGATAGEARSSGAAASPNDPDIVDDPSRWDEAGVVLAPTSFVATVIGPGVASLAEPEPGPMQHWFPNPTQFGGDRAFLVLDQYSSQDYVEVSLPIMPNGQEGWIHRAEIELTEIHHRALVDLSDATVTVWDGDEVIVDTKAVTGTPATPTPVGVFYVRDIIAQPNADGGFGPYILALSGFSEVLETFQGGLPALAIHGTNNPSQIGSRRSNGCLRIPNELITLLADNVPLGTPVTVVA